MFLDATIKQNKKLIDYSIEIHQKGLITPNTYVIDLETVCHNATAMVKEAKKLDMELFFMTKQLGRNVIVSKAVIEAGLEKAVAVDPWEALHLHRHGIPIGHVGHLVQIPQHLIPFILEINPDYITVFSFENASKLSEEALRIGKKQRVFLRIADTNDFIFNGQKGGFTLERLKKDLDNLKKLAGIEIAGLTSFPCLLMESDEVKVSPNVASMQKAKEILNRNGYNHLEMNMPSATSTATMKILKDHGATQGEPGHALTGTTPLHVNGGYPEKQAMVYVTEVSHIYEKHGFVYGGGFYPRSHMKSALVGRDIDSLKRVSVIVNDPTTIDYYGILDTDDVSVGDTVIYAFRTQIFVTNAHVAVVDHMSTSPKLLGIYDSKGNLITH